MNSTYHIIETFPGEADFHLFEALPKAIYTEQQLAYKKTETLSLQGLYAVYVILKNNKPITRCSLYFNPALRYQLQPCAGAGHFESVNEPEAVKTLFDHVGKVVKNNGYAFLMGPMNGSTWENYRLPVAGEGPLFFIEPCYPGYYPFLFETSGFHVIAKYVSQLDEDNLIHAERIVEVKKRFVSQGIRFRNLDLQRYEEELSVMHEFCAMAFKDNFLYTPISKNDFINKYTRIKAYIDPQYVIIAEHADGTMLGFIFCIPNYANTIQKEIIVKTLAKHPSRQYGGMGNVLGSMFKQRAVANQTKAIIHAFMHQNNASRSLSKHFSGKVIREYHLFGKEI